MCVSVWRQGGCFYNQTFGLCEQDHGSFSSGLEEKQQLPQIPPAPLFTHTFSTSLILYQDLLLAFVFPFQNDDPSGNSSIISLSHTHIYTDSESHFILCGIANNNFRNILPFLQEDWNFFEGGDPIMLFILFVGFLVHIALLVH